MKIRNDYRLFIPLILLLISFSIPLSSNAQIKVDVGGYGQAWMIFQDYAETYNPTTGEVEVSKDVSGYRLRRGRLFARSRMTDHFSATVWLDFASPDRNLIDFHLDAHIHPWLNIRAGQFIMSGQMHDTARLVSSRLIFHERPVVTTQLSSIMGYDAFRDIGVMVYGTHGPIWYAIHAGNGTGRYNQAGTQITKRGTFDGLYGARIDVEVTDGLFVGGHASINTQKNVVISGNQPRDIDRKSYSLRLMSDGFGFDRIFTEIEYAAGERDDDQSFTFNGYYAQAGYKITDDFHVLLRYDQYSNNPETGSKFTSDNITFGTLYYVRHNRNEIARIGLNYKTGKNNPHSLDNYIVMAWLQLRFMP